MSRSSVVFVTLVFVLVGACEPQGFFPDDVPRDPDAPCSTDAPAGHCPEGETCRGGECLDDAGFCSQENPTGLCADLDATCTGGSCIAQDDACSVDNPTGACPDGLACTSGACVSDAPCAPDERFGFCEVGGELCLDGACVDRASLCDDDTPGGLCPVGLVCQTGTCVPRDDVCGCVEGQSCVDGVCRNPDQLCSTAVPAGLCAGGSVCTAGSCVDVGASCSTQNPTGVCPPGSLCRAGACAALDGATLCDDDNACTVDTFDPARNRCDNAPLDQEACDDGNSCTTDVCAEGRCVGDAIAGCVEPPVLDPVVTPTNVGTLTISGTKPAGAAVEINDLVAVPESPDTRFRVTVNLVPGENVYRVKSVDQGASSGMRELRVVYDLTPPQTRVSPEGGTFVSGITATIASDEPATIFFTTDGSEPDEYAPSFSSLRQLRIFASMTLKVRARDLAGNLETEARTLRFDITARGSSWREPAALVEGLSRPGSAFAAPDLVVVGGTDGLAAQAGAFAFDVDADAWRTLPSLAGARAGLAVVVVGADIYAIGGENAGTPLNRLEVLRGGAAAWETLAPMPSTRHAAGAVVRDGEIFVFGGAANGSAVVTNVEVYSIADNTWRNDVAAMPRPRAGFGVVVIDNKAFLVGGEDAAGVPVAEVDVYDFSANTWGAAAPLPTPRSFLSVGALHNVGRVVSGDRLIVAAGGRAAGGVASALVEEYVVEDNAWRTRALLPSPRHSAGSAVTVVSDDVDDLRSELWMVGGQVGADVAASIVAYRSSVDHVRRLPDLPEARFLHGAALLGERVYLFGGRDFAEVTTAWAYDPETGAADELPPLPGVQNAPAAVAVGDRVYAIGGFDQFGNAIATVRAFDPVERRWIERQPMTSGRGNATATVVGHEIHVIGGENGAPLPTVEIYDTLRNTWRAGPLLPAPRTGAMAVTHRGRVVVVGGVDDNGFLNSIVARTDTGWETLGGAMPGVSFGYATVLHDRTITIFTGRTEEGLGGSPISYDVDQERVRLRSAPQTWLGAALDRRPGVTVLGRVLLFGGNATDGVGPGGVATVEEIEGRCFNGVSDRREESFLETGDNGDGCSILGFVHQSGTGVTFLNDRPVNTTSLQGAIDACNAHYGSNVCARACDCTVVTRNGRCGCSEPFVWHFGESGCLSEFTEFPGSVTGGNCSGPSVGTWN